MSGFPPLQVEIGENGRSVRLSAPYTVRMGRRTITVPAGFETDFASVPRFFWRVLPPWGRYSPAAAVHDYLYARGELPRSVADGVFLSLMERLGVPWWKRRVMYWAVRLFGWHAWNQHRKAKGLGMRPQR